MRFNSGTLHGRDEQHHDQCKQHAVIMVLFARGLGGARM
jgi:hypothetical protein